MFLVVGAVFRALFSLQFLGRPSACSCVFEEEFVASACLCGGIDPSLVCHLTWCSTGRIIHSVYRYAVNGSLFVLVVFLEMRPIHPAMGPACKKKEVPVLRVLTFNIMCYGTCILQLCCLSHNRLLFFFSSSPLLWSTRALLEEHTLSRESNEISECLTVREDGVLFGS